LSHPISKSELQDATQAPPVLIVILNWNAPQETLDSLSSIHKMDYPNYRVVIIDNGSSDDSLKILSSVVSDKVQIISSPENLGYTGGCNFGFDLALRENLDYVWLLNSDAVTEPGTLSSLVRLAESDPRIGLVSPIIASLETPDRIINVGGLFKPEVPEYHPTRSIEQAKKWSADYPNRMILLGTALLVRTALVRTIGPFDPALFAYWEDTDLSMRSNKAGFLNKVDFDSTVLHSEKLPATHANDLKPHFWYYVARNEIRFWFKHVGPIKSLKPIYWSYQMQLRIFNRLNTNKLARQAVLAGLWDGWLGKRGPYHAGVHMPAIVAAAVRWHSRKYPDAG
jgi:GT2 family glycosyltransferase